MKTDEERQRIDVAVPGGSIAVEVAGSGPLVVCIPGMGESRTSFDALARGLVRTGFRVAVMDLRGHGDSSPDFDSYGDEASAGDVLAVLSALDSGPATLVGNSMGAAAAVLAAAREPGSVDRLVLLAPFVRDHGPRVMRPLLALAMLPPWGTRVWRGYYRTLFAEPTAPGRPEHIARALSLLRRPGRWRAFRRTASISHAVAERALPDVHAPALVLMGERDPDFPDPEAEATWVAAALGGRHAMVAGAGHYPQVERPGVTLGIIVPFLRSAGAGGRLDG